MDYSESNSPFIDAVPVIPELDLLRNELFIYTVNNECFVLAVNFESKLQDCA